MWKVGTTATAASSAPSSKDGKPQGRATGALSKDWERQPYARSQAQARTALSRAERGGLRDGSSSA